MARIFGLLETGSRSKSLLEKGVERFPIATLEFRVGVLGGIARCGRHSFRKLFTRLPRLSSLPTPTFSEAILGALRP
ncbi:hypothetical protein [Sphingomonas sp.]|uniref:hypothetical protein n=1 Tax=Sphingomonas sp. TaxID=28214 RepID=UPI0035C84FA5